MALPALLTLAPIGSLVVFAWRGDAQLWPHLFAYVLPTALLQTLGLLLGTAALTAVVGTGAAWLVTAYRFAGRDTLVWMLTLPLAFPTYIVAYIYVEIFDTPALGAWAGGSWLPAIRSLPGAIVILSLVLYPYVYLAARAMFQTQSASLIEVARTLGAGRWALARHVALPLARPALAVGLSLVMLETLNDIGATEYLGVHTLTLAIFTTWLNRGSLGGAAQIACVMLAVVAGLIALERYGRRQRRFSGSARNARAPRPIALAGGAAAFAGLACALPVVLGFALPAAFLVRETVRRDLLTGFDPDLIRHTLTTLSLSAVAAAATLAMGFGMVTLARMRPHPVMTGLTALASLGYAVPGTVLALGLLAPLVAVDEAINTLTRAAFGIGVGLVLAGSGAAVVLAYVIRFLTIAAGSAQAGMARISPHMDAAARTLGASPAEVTWRVHLPLLRPAIGGAALLVFVDALKELPATLLLRPLNVETLPTYLYQFASRGSFEEGALAALLIVAAGLVPIIRMARYADAAAGLPFAEASSPLGADPGTAETPPATAVSAIPPRA